MAKHDNWQTPPTLLAALAQEFRFDMDAAATSLNAVCPNFISEDQDALVTLWSGSCVWCNPPYSRLGDFTERAKFQQRQQNNTVVMLVPAYTDTGWWYQNIARYSADEVRFIVGRLRFWENGAPGKETARFPSALVIWRPRAHGYLPVRAHHTYMRRPSATHP